MQALHDNCGKIDPASLAIRFGRPDDAPQVARLYRAVYGRDYPSPELFTEAGMRAFLTPEQSHATTYLVTVHGNIIASATFQVQGHAALSRGFMVTPSMQGKIGARHVFLQILQDARHDLAGRVDYFYGECRTETAKIQGVIEEAGWRPLGTLPFKDIFARGRETEILYACYIHEPPLGGLRLTSRAAQVASTILQRPIPPVCSSLSFPRNVPEVAHQSVLVTEPAGEEILNIMLPGGASLEAHVCPAPRNSEKVVIHSNIIEEYIILIQAYLAEIVCRGIEYAEIYVAADDLARQNVLEQFGFTPTGFMPCWHAPGDRARRDCVLYTIHFPSTLPEVTDIRLTPRGEVLRPFIPPTCMNAKQISLAPIMNGGKTSPECGAL